MDQRLNSIGSLLSLAYVTLAGVFNTINKKKTPKADLMLGQYLRRWANVNPALVCRLMVAGHEA